MKPQRSCANKANNRAKVVELNTKFQAIVVLLIFSMLASGKPITARTWKPGVDLGDCFYYQMYGVYTSNRSNTSLVIPPFEHNNTDWVRINATGIEGSIVYQVYALHFKNGSEINCNFRTDVDPVNASRLKFSDKGIPICGANLNAGDQLPTAELTINETIIRVYSSGSRETNHVSWNSWNDWGDCYFDRATGMLVELHRIHKFTNNFTGEAVEKTDEIRLISTNRWEIKTSQLSIARLFLFLATTVFALFSFLILTYRFVTKKTRNRQAAIIRLNYK